jgi:hypothetical protein
MFQLIRVSAIEIDVVWRERERGNFFKEGNFLGWHVIKEGIEEGRGGQLVWSGTL